MALSIRMLKPLARIQITKSKSVISVRKSNTTPTPSVCASVLNLVTFQNNKHNLQPHKWWSQEKKHDFTIDRLVVVFIIIIIIELKKKLRTKTQPCHQVRFAQLFIRAREIFGKRRIPRAKQRGRKYNDLLLLAQAMNGHSQWQ